MDVKDIKTKTFYFGDKDDIVNYVTALIYSFQGQWHGERPEGIVMGATDYLIFTTELRKTMAYGSPSCETVKHTKFMGIPVYPTESVGITLIIPENLVTLYAIENKRK